MGLLKSQGQVTPQEFVAYIHDGKSYYILIAG